MKIEIPDLRAEETLKFLKELNEINTSYSMDVQFEFSSTWVEPLGMLLCSSGIKQFRQINENVNMHMTIPAKPINNACDYAGHMGFFKNISELINVGKAPGEASGNSNYVPITVIDFNKLHRSEIKNGNFVVMNDVVETESKRLAEVLCRTDENLQKLFSYIIREILRNIPEHSESHKAMICAQYWKTGKAQISILDEGIGIKQSLVKNSVHRQYIDSDSEALKASIRPGISQAFSPNKKNKSLDEWSNSGFGLFMASEICKQLDGKFWIVSGNKAFRVNSSNNQIFDTHFNGTAIGVSFNTNKLIDSQEMITEIAKRGEEQAKKIRNAFSHASSPSKTLWMDES